MSVLEGESRMARRRGDIDSAACLGFMCLDRQHSGTPKDMVVSVPEESSETASHTMGSESQHVRVEAGKTRLGDDMKPSTRTTSLTMRVSVPSVTERLWLQTRPPSYGKRRLRKQRKMPI